MTSDRQQGIAWNLNHPVDLRMLLDIANTLDELRNNTTSPDGRNGTNETSHALVAHAIRTHVDKVTRGDWS